MRKNNHKGLALLFVSLFCLVLFAGCNKDEPGSPTVIPETPTNLDASFNPGSGADYEIYSIAPQSDGKILIGGQFFNYNSTERNKIARLNADGSLDTSFDPGLGVGDLTDVRWLYSIAVQGDGKILIGGSFNTYNGTIRNNIARLNVNGSLDTSFISDFGSVSVVHCIAIQNDGKILIGGQFTAYDGTARSRIARLNADGSLDTTFNPGTGVTGGLIVESIALQTDGKIIIGGGFSTYNGTTRNGIARLNSDGSLDASFNPGSGANDVVSDIAIQNDGKILIGGNFTSYNGTSINRIAKLNTDGTLDTDFNPGTGANNPVISVAIQSDGKILIGGWFGGYNESPRQKIARLNAGGSLDTTFDPGTGATGGTVESIALQSDGKILIGGGFSTYNGTARNKIARILP